MTDQTNSGSSCCGSCGTGAATDVQVHGVGVGVGVTTTYKVSGMTCGHCETAVSKEISALDGVTAVTAVAETGEVKVTSTAPLDQEAVRAAVDEAGYELVGRD
ncbi:heavy-metal-associated domain-containing protein [Streptomyces flaveolus]|uniref:heavy-metal-associated domain-containing protein n=1 Tax=Streptomyces flaveolus TaxID=67297 RepID=UPI00343BFE50